MGVGVIAQLVVDDSFLQPQPGTSPGDHLVSGLVPLASLALAAAAHGRVRGSGRAAIGLVVGFFGVATGIEAAYYTTQVGPSGDDFTGLLSTVAGLALFGSQVTFNRVVTTGTAVFSNGAAPDHLIDQVDAIAPRAVFLISHPASTTATRRGSTARAA